MRKHLCWALAFAAQMAFAQRQPITIPASTLTTTLATTHSTFHLPSNNSLVSSISWTERPNSYAEAEGIRTFVGHLNGRLVGGFSNDRSGNVLGELHLDQTYDIISQHGQVQIQPAANASAGCGVEDEAKSSFSLPSATAQSRRFTRSSSDGQDYQISDGNYRILRLAVLVSATDLDSPQVWRQRGQSEGLWLNLKRSSTNFMCATLAFSL